MFSTPLTQTLSQVLALGIATTYTDRENMCTRWVNTMGLTFVVLTIPYFIGAGKVMVTVNALSVLLNLLPLYLNYHHKHLAAKICLVLPPIV